jgi:phospho-N-acetylmuramoyl-pentapeptide-transferase
MIQLLGLVLLSFALTSIFMVPFIDLLFVLKRRFEKKDSLSNIKNEKDSPNPIHDKLMKGDEGTPSGGGILLILILIILSIGYALFSSAVDKISLKILIVTLALFGCLGLVDDIKFIITRRKGKFLGLNRRIIFVIQLIFAFILAYMLYFFANLNNFYIPVIGNFIIGIWYVPVAAFIIISFANAYNISDGLDGLAAGLLLICLFAFLALSTTVLDLTLASFIGIWIGILFAYLYFNVWPARIFLGDAGGFGFGAALAVVGLLTGKILALAIIGGMFIIIVTSSLLQILSKKLLKRKIMPISPLHMYFKYIGWEEPKIVTRFWLAQGLFAIFGLWIALLSR